MKNISNRCLVILALVLLCCCGIAVLCVRFASNGSEWATNRVNAHLYSSGEFIGAGTIYDIKGEILVQTQDSQRTYNSSKRVRKSLLHILGDNEGFITNSIQSEYSSYLAGYSYVNGLYDTVTNGKGKDMTLTLDSEVCAVAYDALDGRKGAVAVYNYKTGDVLCSISSPTYDIRNKPDDIDTDTSGEYDGIYVNRVTSGLFVPGSIFKIVTAACAIDNLPDIESREFKCTGKATVGGVTVTCPSKHGTMDFEEAFASSCNCTFAALAVELGAEKLTATAEACGFNSPFSCGKIAVTGSRLNLTDCDDGELAWAGVGQYTTLVNPLCYLRIVGAVANGGISAKPNYIYTEKNALSDVHNDGIQYLSASTCKRLTEMMRNNVVSVYGDSRFPDVDMCGKTGTAEVTSDGDNHAWFAGFSSDSDCPLAIIVIVENGGSGSGVAVPVAAKVMDAAYESVMY